MMMLRVANTTAQPEPVTKPQLTGRKPHFGAVHAYLVASGERALLAMGWSRDLRDLLESPTRGRSSAFG
ncbi:hypothetical protein [Amycolatopsis sp. RTGN1]|uniref:hypothetical protein n=1 Tax=Amycolatopsis ponsaeliensis TaxID=2992142 RepID=UPI00254B78E9|nr:hypothetical protein [Amycolatopsis sp. RTGN1]